MVPVLLSSVQISELLEKLEALGDQSFKLRCAILFEKHYPSEQHQVWVDVWPEFTTILVKQKLSQKSAFIYYTFTLDKERLKIILENTDIVEWENAVFQGYSYEHHQIIEDVAKKRGFQLRCIGNGYRLYKFNANKFKPRPVPEDITVGSLTPDMDELVSKTWHIPLYDEENVPHIRYLIKNYQSVCLYDINGIPVAFEVEQEYGGLGMLFVEPACRKRGLGKLVTNLLVRKCADHGYPPFVGVSDLNESSIKLHIDLGFEKTDIIYPVSKVIRKEK